MKTFQMLAGSIKSALILVEIREEAAYLEIIRGQVVCGWNFISACQEDHPL